MKKRTLCMLLSLIAAASAFASCGDGAQTPAKQTEKTTNAVENNPEVVEKVPSAYDLMEEKDLGGRTYTIFDCNSYPEMHINLPGEAMTGEIVNDALILRDTALEDRYNFVLDYYQENSMGKLNKAVQAGDTAYDLVITTMGNLSGSASSGYLFNFWELPDVAPSLNEKWWSPLMTKALTLNNALYFTANDIAPAVYQAPCCMFLNLKLYSDYDIDTDIYQLVLDGKWTIEALEKITHDMDVDMNGDNKWDAENDFYGITMQPTSETAGAFLSAANVSLSSISDDGTNLVFDALDNQKLMDACEKLTTIARNISYKDINDISNISFKQNHALFLQHKLESAAVHLRDMDADYLILPDPKFDEAQETYMSFVSIHVNGFIGLPATVDPEFDGFVTEALARYSNEYIRATAFDTVYKQKDSRDPRSVEVLDLLLDNLYIDFTSVYNFGTLNDTLSDVIFKGKAIASTLEKKRASAEKAIAKLVDKWNVD